MCYVRNRDGSAANQAVPSSLSDPLPPGQPISTDHITPDPKLVMLEFFERSGGFANIRRFLKLRFFMADIFIDASLHVACC